LRQLDWFLAIISRICSRFCWMANSSISFELMYFLLVVFLDNLESRDSWLRWEQELITDRCASTLVRASVDSCVERLFRCPGVASRPEIAVRGRLGVVEAKAVAVLREGVPIRSAEAGRRQG